MSDLQFISHQLISMFPVGFTQILVKHDPVDNRQARINTIDYQQNQIRNVLGLKDLFS